MTEPGRRLGRTPTAPDRSDSRKAELQRQISKLIADSSSSAGWTADGFRPDLELLGRILARTDPEDVRVGSVATGLDLWAAATLRTAGLRAVRPYAFEPFYAGSLANQSQDTFELIDDGLNELEELGGRLSRGASVLRATTRLATRLRGLQRHLERNRSTLLDEGRNVQTEGAIQQVLDELDELSASLSAGTGFRKAARTLTGQLKRLRAEIERSATSVLGESRKKQVDVFIAEWDRGLELLISTKTFALAVEQRDLVKNLPNRWEEFDGDLKNLRGRFPLAVIGALTILPALALHGTLPAFVDMMMKLTAPGRPWVNAYDRASIVVADWEQATEDFVPILNDELPEEQLPSVLQPSTFFDALLDRLFERAPVQEHQEARIAAAEARGVDSTAITEAAAAVEDSRDESSG